MPVRDSLSPSSVWFGGGSVDRETIVIPNESPALLRQERDFRRGIRYPARVCATHGQKMRTPRNPPTPSEGTPTHLSAYLPTYLRFTRIRVGSACAQITKWILAARAAFSMIRAVVQMDRAKGASTSDRSSSQETVSRAKHSRLSARVVDIGTVRLDINTGSRFFHSNRRKKIQPRTR